MILHCFSKGQVTLIKKDNLYWDVSDILKSIDESFDVCCHPDLSDIDESFSDVEVTGKIKNIAGAVLTDLSVSGSYKTSCDRCLEDVTLSLKAEIHTSVSEDGCSKDDSLFIENGKIDFAKTAADALYLEIPSKILCCDDCEGIIVPEEQF